MKEIFYRNVVLREKDLGHRRKQKIVVDTETGEILGKWYGTAGTDLFLTGCNAEIRQVMVSREKWANGMEKVFISGPDGTEKRVYIEKLLTEEGQRFGARKGTGKGRGRTRGGLAEIRVTEENIKRLKKELSYESLGFFFSLATLARHDTGLVADRARPMAYKEILEVLKVPERSGSRYIGALLKAGVLIKQEEGYYINQQFIKKG